MIQDNQERIVFLTVIASRNLKNALVKSMLDGGIRMVNTSYGRGTVDAPLFMKALGFAPEKNKEVLTCISTSSKIDAFLKVLIEKFEFGKPNTGIAFTIPVNMVSF
jgi:hypothetical protein